jgi:predicted DNA-binding transcriptional regulator AlpA
MTVAKSEITRPYAPDYVDVTTLAYRLSVSESTIERWERDRKLPRRRSIFGIQRWKWSEVEAFVDGLLDSGESVETDHFMERLSA